jgi:hypothetical protein
MMVVGNGKQFQMVFRNQKGQLCYSCRKPKNKGEFYAINNRGLFCSTNTGLAWRELGVSWSKEYLSQHPWALAVKGQD